jgi:ABC-type thiamin/hydroxymethylpyrimidine transport system permease subunit
MSQKNSVKKIKFCNGYVMFSAGQNIIYCTKQLLEIKLVCGRLQHSIYNINYKFNAAYG